MIAPSKILTSIGLMSGTSLDGVDVALLKTDGQDYVEPGPVLHYPYSRDVKIWVQRAIRAALEGRDGAEEIGKATSEVTSAHIRAVQKLMEKNYLSREEIDVVGFHGQTILHRPPVDTASVGRTWQIGAGQMIADELRLDVVDQFRQADMANGGEGAPLAPVYHAMLVRAMKPGHSVCVLNLGGVANITWVPSTGAEKRMVAFDCGPGNGLIDEWVLQQAGTPMDKDGALAAAGTPHEETVRLMALASYLRKKPPKSLDRYDFKMTAMNKMTLEDGAATLTAFSAACVEKSVSLLPEAPGEWIVVGGGRHNPVLMRELQARLAAPVRPAEAIGWRGDDLEAECFAYLAVRALKKLPLSFPLTTSVPHPLSGGSYHRAPV